MSCAICGFINSAAGSRSPLELIRHTQKARLVLETIPGGKMSLEIREALQLHIREIDVPANGNGEEVAA